MDNTFKLTKGISKEMAVLNAISNRSWNKLKRRKINNKYYIPICSSTITYALITTPMTIYKQHKPRIYWLHQIITYIQ